MAQKFLTDIRLPNSGQLYLWHDHDSNYLKYDRWRASASAGMNIQNVAATGEIYLRSNNALTLTLDGTGQGIFENYLGIGGNTPTVALDVKGTNNLSSRFIFTKDGTTDKILFGGADHDSFDTFVGSSSNHSFTITQNGAAAITIATNKNATFAGNIKTSASNPFVTIEGNSASYVNGGIQFITNHASSARGLGTFYYNAHTDVEWFAGLPYSGNDAFVINRNSSYTVPSSESSPPGVGASAGTLFSIASSGNATFANDITTPGTIFLPGNGNTATREALIDAHGTRSKLMKEGNAVYWQVAQGSNQFEITDAANGNSAKGNVLLRTSGHDDYDNKLILVPNSGKVGIGTTTPTAPLHIEGATNSEVLKIEADSNPYIRWVENGTNVGFLQFLGDHAYLSNMSNGSFFFRTNNTTKMTILSGGNVGIGTTSPQKKLDVYLGTDSAVASIGGTIGVGEYAGLHFGYSETGNSLYRHSAIVFERDDSAFGDARGKIHILNSASGSASADLGDARLTILPSGNVGIGTTSPTTKLDVKSSGSNIDEISLIHSGNTVKIASLGQESGHGSLVLRNNSGTIQTRLSAGGNNSYILNSNLGIGTTSPGKPLDVLGDIRSIDSSSNQHQLRATQVISYGTDAILNAQSAGDDVRLNTQGSTRLIATAEGNVGIGTTSPYYKLDMRFANTDTSLSGGGNGNWGSEGIRVENTINTAGTMSVLHLRNGDADIHIAGIRRGTNDSDLGFFWEGSQKVLFENDGSATFAGVLALPDGSATAPSIGNTGDTNTGMYWPGDHQLGFSVNGSRKMYMSETKTFFQNQSQGVEINNGLTIVSGGIDVTGEIEGDSLDINGNADIAGELQVTTNGTATLILRGDNNNSGDSGQLDSTIKMLHDDGTHGILMETKNYAGKQSFEIKSLAAGTESSRFLIHQDNYIVASGGATFAGYVSAGAGFRMASGQAIDFVDSNIGYNSIERDTTNGGLQINTGGTASLNILDNGNATFAGNVTVNGNLTVDGTTTTLNTQTVEVEDNIIQLNTTQGSPDTATAATSGISVYRGDGVTQASFIFDDGDDTWDLTNNLTVAGAVEMASGKITSDGSAPAGAYLELKHANNNATDVCATINLTNNVGGYAAIVGGTTGANNTGYIEFKTDNAGTQGTVLTLNGDNSATFTGDVTLAGTLTNNVTQASADVGNTVTLTKINSNNAYTEYTGFLKWTYSGTGSNPYTFNLVFEAGSLDVAYEVVLRTGRNGNWRNFGAMKDFGYIYNESDGDFKHNAEGDVTIASSLGTARFSLDSDPVGFGATADNQTSDPGTGNGLYSKFIRRYSFNFENNTTGSDAEWEIYVKVYNFAGDIKFLKA